MAEDREGHAWQLIDDAEPPISVREFDELLAKDGLMTRSQRRLAWRAIHDAGLLIFKA